MKISWFITLSGVVILPLWGEIHELCHCHHPEGLPTYLPTYHCCKDIWMSGLWSFFVIYDFGPETRFEMFNWENGNYTKVKVDLRLKEMLFSQPTVAVWMQLDQPRRVFEFFFGLFSYGIPQLTTNVCLHSHMSQTAPAKYCCSKCNKTKIVSLFATKTCLKPGESAGILSKQCIACVTIGKNSRQAKKNPTSNNLDSDLPVFDTLEDLSDYLKLDLIAGQNQLGQEYEFDAQLWLQGPGPKSSETYCPQADSIACELWACTNYWWTYVISMACWWLFQINYTDTFWAQIPPHTDCEEQFRHNQICLQLRTIERMP